MIYGIGTDILAVERISSLHQKYGDALARRVLSPSEYQQSAGCSDMVRLIAKRFAIKEAFAKAVGTGVREPVSLRHISVVHDESGKPELAFAPELQTWLDERNICRVHISLSDERDYICAFAIAEC
ncbi:holo-ACP synthase [Kingella kingae]|uniref:holo-ACP synthase n=1 Tax=Kingella kingae TaxID=504 RepID=UPI000427A491|nr:holo-ACP synthase [Kingella kingae]MDK4624321.1 holo-ACP synthase [Kingella kingae]MDK4659946.1 holo-ACP synthase [Kingella kingae]MDK4667873.1 holo-ACP synthase [Kingella kingae]MDK4686235.1 holo-ACP synthase [Kingella kingae]